MPLPVISKAIGIVGPFEPDVHDAFLLVVDFAITEATTVIDLAFSMKVTRQWPIRSRHPAVPKLEPLTGRGGREGNRFHLHNSA